MFRRIQGRPRPDFPPRTRQPLIALLLLLLWVQLANVPDARVHGRQPASAQSPPQQSAGARAEQEVTTLEPDKPVERELSGGQKQTYQLPLTQGQYANVTVEQRGVAVCGGVLGAGGPVMADVDSQRTAQGTER